MVFGWFKEHHRAAITAQPFPPAWEEFLRHNVHLYAKLSSQDQAKLRDILRIVIAEKNWEGCGGLEINEEVQVTVAGQAALLLLGIPHDYFSNVETILVYPTAFTMPKPRERDTFNPVSGTWLGGGGVVDLSPNAHLGEAWSQGPVILSWQDVVDGGRNETDGHNVVLHEFAHKLDLRDRSADGVPHLASRAEYDNWSEVMSAEYQALVENTEHHHATLLNSYGATNAAEFFAVATEAFFEKSLRMRETHRRLYDTLAGFYHQDPATWS